MKHKTSVAIDEALLASLKQEAIRRERPVSYLINEMIEEKLAHLSEEPGEYGRRAKKHRRAKAR